MFEQARHIKSRLNKTQHDNSCHVEPSGIWAFHFHTNSLNQPSNLHLPSTSHKGQMEVLNNVKHIKTKENNKYTTGRK